MYCVQCGVELAETEHRCPLCATPVHPPVPVEPAEPMYPRDRFPPEQPGIRVLRGSVSIAFLIPMFISFWADYQTNGSLEWFGYVWGGLGMVYALLVLPLWLPKEKKLLPVILDFLAALLYLLYINLAAGGSWFFSFALPVTLSLGLITCLSMALLEKLHRGKLCVLGGTSMAAGLFVLQVELLLQYTFGLRFIGWSLYPLIVLALFGCFLIHLAANTALRQILERKLFF